MLLLELGLDPSHQNSDLHNRVRPVGYFPGIRRSPPGFRDRQVGSGHATRILGSVQQGCLTKCNGMRACMLVVRATEENSKYSSAEYFKEHQEPPCMGWRPRAGPAGPRASNGTDAACNNRLKEPGLQRHCVTGAECQKLNESEPGLSSPRT